MGGYSTGKAFSFIKTVIGETKRRSSTKLFRSLESREFFKKEILTLKMSLPRRMGNTTLAVKLFKFYKNSLLVIPSMSYLMGTMTYGVFDKSRVVTPQMQLDCLDAVPVVIVDVATWMKPEQIEKIYDIKSDFYVFLG